MSTAGVKTPAVGEQAIIAKFYVSGGLVETYHCQTAPPCQADHERMTEIKQDLVRNFGYAPIVIWEYDLWQGEG